MMHQFQFVFIYVYFIPLILVSGHNVVRIIHNETVETNDGAVRGRLEETFLNQKPYLSFRGIPFAKPPIGELRFKAPVPVDPWRPKTIDAFEYSKACSQMRYLISDTESSEDCLYLNVFVPGDKFIKFFDELKLLKIPTNFSHSNK